MKPSIKSCAIIAVGIGRPTSLVCVGKKDLQPVCVCLSMERLTPWVCIGSEILGGAPASPALVTLSMHTSHSGDKQATKHSMSFADQSLAIPATAFGTLRLAGSAQEDRGSLHCWFRSTCSASSSLPGGVLLVELLVAVAYVALSV